MISDEIRGEIHPIISTGIVVTLGRTVSILNKRKATVVCPQQAAL
jgi:hypothetical protein